MTTLRRLDGRRRSGVIAGGAVLLAVIAPAAPAQESPPRCGPDAGPIVVEATAQPAAESTYVVHPFEVLPGTTRVEVAYRYADLTQAGQLPFNAGVVDLGLWDADGVGTVDGFRGWGGSNHGVEGRHEPIWVQADSAARAFNPGPVEPGVWHVEAGLASVPEGGLAYAFTIACLDVAVGAPWVPDAVDPFHVADAEPGWYHGDFHMHASNSTETGPSNDEVVAHAREVGLDFLPITDYVANRTYGQWGATQRANPDLVIWPGREIITYFGHAISLGETPSVVDYRHGFEDVTLRGLFSAIVDDGGLVGLAHPTYFPAPVDDVCRGCHFDLLDDIDLDDVTLYEAHAGAIEQDPSAVGGPQTEGIENPFVMTNLDLYEDLLARGHRLALVAGSDEKSADGHGITATAVWAERLSRPALVDGLRRGRSYVRTIGAIDSPTLDFTATAGDDTVMLGGTLVAEIATMQAVVGGGVGQTLEVSRNGTLLATAPITSDPFTFSWTGVRGVDGGPAGTFHRVDVRNADYRTILSGPIWLATEPAPEPEPAPTAAPTPTDPAPSEPAPTPDPSASEEPAPTPTEPAGPALPATGGGLVVGALSAFGALAMLRRRRP